MVENVNKINYEDLDSTLVVQLTVSCEKCVGDYKSIIGVNLVNALLSDLQLGAIKKNKISIWIVYEDDENLGNAMPKIGQNFIYERRDFESIKKMFSNKILLNLSNYILENITYADSYIVSQGIIALNQKEKYFEEPVGGIGFIFDTILLKEEFGIFNSRLDMIRRLQKMFKDTSHNKELYHINHLLRLGGVTNK